MCAGHLVPTDQPAQLVTCVDAEFGEHAAQVVVEVVQQTSFVPVCIPKLGADSPMFGNLAREPRKVLPELTGGSSGLNFTAGATSKHARVLASRAGCRGSHRRWAEVSRSNL